MKRLRSFIAVTTTLLMVLSFLLPVGQDVTNNNGTDKICSDFPPFDSIHIASDFPPFDSIHIA